MFGLKVFSPAAITLGGIEREHRIRKREFVFGRSYPCWYLIVGKNPLSISKQHGHSAQTMLDTYAACTQGACC